jgi:hypothetical protein
MNTDANTILGKKPTFGYVILMDTFFGTHGPGITSLTSCVFLLLHYFTILYQLLAFGPELNIAVKEKE